jgi:hypothetical protein
MVNLASTVDPLSIPCVYKYLPSNRLSYLKDALLRFTPPGALNDPFECLPALPTELLLETWEYLQKPPPQRPGTSRSERRATKRLWQKAVAQTTSIPRDPQSLSEMFFTQATKNINEKLGVLSLSRRWDSSLMWAHYTNAHTGFCVGFNKNHSFFQNTRPISEDDLPIAPVTYSMERSIVPDERPNSVEVMRILLTKSKDWEYEAEERLLGLLARATKNVDAAPFNIALFEVPHSAVTELIVGINATAELSAQVQKAARMLKVPAYKAVISKSSFNVERVKI